MGVRGWGQKLVRDNNREDGEGGRLRRTHSQGGGEGGGERQAQRDPDTDREASVPLLSSVVVCEHCLCCVFTVYSYRNSPDALVTSLLVEMHKSVWWWRQYSVRGRLIPPPQA